MNSLKDTRILITGGAGFIGSYIGERLLDERIKEIVIIDNFVRGSRKNIERALASGRVRLIEGDIRDRGFLEEYFQGVDYCFHLAALRITHCAAEPREALGVMSTGTYNVLEACVHYHIKKIILGSAASVYGQADSFPTKEDHHPNNNYTFYGAAKMANELMCRSFYHMYNLNFTALRYFNIYGPRMDTYGKYTEVLVRWYHCIREGKEPLIYGDGQQTMDFIYIEDVVRASMMALKADANNEVFNIAGGKETSLKELCHLLLDVMGSNLKPKYVSLPEDRKKVEVTRRWADVSKAEKMIGFQARVNLRDGLKRLVQWLDEQKKTVGV